MNFGVASGYADYSGELYIIKHVARNIASRTNPVIFDVGANVGDWSRFLIQEFKKIDYCLYLFEPGKEAFKKLIQNIPASRLHFFHCNGFGEKTGTGRIYYDECAEGAAGAFHNGIASEEIRLETIDSFCEKNGIEHIEFLKMDVQGFELSILKGARKMLRERRIRFIQFELDEPAIEARIFFKDFWNLLHENYEIYHSLYNGIMRIEKYHFSHENFMCMNYLARLKEIR